MCVPADVCVDRLLRTPRLGLVSVEWIGVRKERAPESGHQFSLQVTVLWAQLAFASGIGFQFSGRSFQTPFADRSVGAAMTLLIYPGKFPLEVLVDAIGQDKNAQTFVFLRIKASTP